jgi:hypothetical protein
LVTRFRLEPGYVFTREQEISPEQLQRITKEIGTKTDLIYKKCLEYGLKEKLPCGCSLSKLVERYKEIPTEDGFCYYTEYGVEQSAFSDNGQKHRMVREQMCRAFFMFVLDECYKKGYSVSFEIH